MTFDDYQKQAMAMDVFPWKGDPPKLTDPAYVAKILGLVGEAGEAADKFKKLIRDEKDQPDESERQELLKELGDVLWYIAVLAKYLGSDLDPVAKNNIEKLADRKSRGVLKSKGDNR